MKIYILMCLNDVIGNEYYTDEDAIVKKVDEMNASYEGGYGDIGYMTLTKREEGDVI